MGLHDVGPTILDLVGAPPLPDTDGASFKDLVADPAAPDERFRRGYAEYHGGRYLLTQRILWDGSWQLVFNGFAEDEL